MAHLRVHPEERVLWRTNVGSHMWGMNHAGSDVDIFEVYLASTRGILVGTAETSSEHREFHDETPKLDVAAHEIGKVVQYVLDGNVNFLWGTFSPIVIEGLPALMSFRAVAERNLSARCHDSIHGLAMHNWAKYIATGKDVTPKRLNIIGRTLLMGIGLLETGKIEFRATTLRDATELERLINGLDYALKHTVLPPEPREPEATYDWLYERRLEDLGGTRDGRRIQD